MKAVWSRFWGIPVNSCEGLTRLPKYHSILGYPQSSSLFSRIQQTKTASSFFWKCFISLELFQKLLTGIKSREISSVMKTPTTIICTGSIFIG